MQFAASTFLWAMFALLIPVIVHLFDFRRYKKVMFSDNYLLKQLLEKNKKQRRLRQLIIMSLRILAIAALVLAFARPFIPSDKITNQKGGQLLVTVYLDNSLSMDLSVNESILFEEARKTAKNIAESYSQNVLFRLLTNDFNAVHDRFVTRDEFVDLLNRLNISSYFRPMSDVMARIYDLLEKQSEADHHVFVISDFQKSSADLTNLDLHDAQFFFVPVSQETPVNIGIDSIWFNAPVQLRNKAISVSARIRNFSNLPVEKIPVRLYVDNKQKGISDIQIAAGGSEIVNFGFTVGQGISHHGYIEIDDSPVSFDDRMFFAFDMAREIPVMHIQGPLAGTSVQALFDNDSLFEYSRNLEQEISFTDLSNADFIILDELSELNSGLSREVLDAVNKGSSVLLIPSTNYQKKFYAPFFNILSINGLNALDTSNTRVAYLDYRHPLFNEVFETAPKEVRLPEVKSSYRLASNEGRSIMKLLNGQSFLTEYKYGQGNVYLLAVPLDPSFSSFSANAMIVPTFIQMAFQSKGLLSIAYPLDYEDGIEFSQASIKSDEPPHLQSFDANIDMLPSFTSGTPTMIYLMGQLTVPGPYRLTDQDKVLRSFALNYNRRESFPDIYSNEELNLFVETKPNLSLFDNQADMSITLSELQYGKRLWKTFIIFALIFLAVEVILLRLWKIV